MITFNLKKRWFDKIKSGEKTHEYREVKSYWTKRFIYQEGGERRFDHFGGDFYITIEKGIKEGSIIKFACGYPTKDEKDKILNAKIKSIKIINGKDTDLKIDKPVYDIVFELIKE